MGPVNASKFAEDLASAGLSEDNAVIFEAVRPTKLHIVSSKALSSGPLNNSSSGHAPLRRTQGENPYTRESLAVTR